MVVNAFSILDQEMNSIATGIYLGVSVTDHSCKPNAVATFVGTTLYIRTIENLSSVDWSKVQQQTNCNLFGANISHLYPIFRFLFRTWI